MSKTAKTKEIAAAKAGMNVKTASRYLAEEQLPSETKVERTWRTRKDPFEGEWEKIQQRIEVNPGLEAKTITKPS